MEPEKEEKNNRYTIGGRVFIVVIIPLIVLAIIMMILAIITPPSHIITVGNQPNWCENDGEFHAFVYDAYGKGEYKGNWSQVKNFLIYQHNKYGVDWVIDSPTFRSGRIGDIRYSLDEYLRMKDAQCGPGAPLEYGIDILDPGLTPQPTLEPSHQLMVTPTPPYDYDGFGKVKS